jgi:hypothetical protein
MCFWRVRVCVCMYVTHQGRHQSQVIAGSPRRDASMGRRLCWCRTSIGPTRTAGPGFGPPAACWHDSPQPADPPRSAAQHRGLQCTQRARHDERPPAPASGARHEMSCGLLRLALDTRCLAGSSAAGCAASSCRETCASSSDSSATPYPLGLAVFLDEEPVPVAAARAGTVPWATAARRSAPDAPALAGSLPLPPALARSLSLPPAPARMGDGFSNSASARVSDKGGHLASRDVRLPKILLWMAPS